MQAALTAVIALLSLSLVSCFLDIETFEHYFQRKGQRVVVLTYMNLALALLALALIVLPGTAQTESFSDAGGWTQIVYIGSAIIAVSGFIHQTIARGEMMKSQNQKTRAKEDNNNRLSDSANHSVGSSADSQQQELDTPEEDGRKLQEEPSPTGSQNRGESGTAEQSSRSVSTPKEGTEDSRKPHA